MAAMLDQKNEMNEINTIFPYRYMGMWVFDDQRVGLLREPFVSGADTMIDIIVADIPNAKRGFTLIFSTLPFPGHQYRLERREAEGGGNWYYSPQLGMKGWLCPALLRYFPEAPQEIYVQVKSLIEASPEQFFRSRNGQPQGFKLFTSELRILFMKGFPFLRRCGFAFRGIGSAWSSENSFRFQVAAAVFIVLLLIIIRPSALWAALLLTMTGMVLATELFNTALEKLIDHLHPDWHENIGLIKDIMAGAVLLLCSTAVIVFGAFLWEMLKL